MRVPIELPGASVPPLIVVLPTMPMPPSVPPALTVTAELAIEPFTDSGPPSTVVAPYRCWAGQDQRAHAGLAQRAGAGNVGGKVTCR